MSDIKKAAIYVGTYHKYNCGSLFGKWMNLADYDSKEDFYKACKELHKDETDPEFMFQDREYIPENFVSESWVSPIVWDLIALDDNDADIVEHYCRAKSISIDDDTDIDELVSEANEHYIGQFEDEEELGRREFEEFILPSIPEGIRATIENYFDCEAYGHSLMVDYWEDDGYYFY
jgi:antirestriction protein